MTFNNKHEMCLYGVAPGQIFLTSNTRKLSVLPMSYDQAQYLLGRDDPPSLLMLNLEKNGHGYTINGDPPLVFGSHQVVEVLDARLDRKYVCQHLPIDAIESYRKNFSRL
ncbi:MAG: hypothetical protein AABW61_01570 [Candidatus Aenigmatarchaeota archaeon]